MSSPGATVYRDSGTGEYYTRDQDGNRRPATMQALPSRPRTINPTSQYSTITQLQGVAGASPPATQEGRPSGNPVTYQPRAINQSVPTVYPTGLSSSFDSTARSDSRLASPISQSPSNQWTPNTSPSVHSVQARSPKQSIAVPTSTIRSTDATYAQYVYPAGSPPSGSGAPTSTGGDNGRMAQTPMGGNAGQLVRGNSSGQLPHRQDLDPSYKVRPKAFFFRGRVLLTLWSEPHGRSTSRRGPSSGGRSLNKDVYTVAYRERAFCKVRRYIVIGEGDRSCTAIAISTHCGTGATYMQQDQSQYGLVYTGTRPPQISTSESGMQPVAIRVDPDNAAMPLDPMSRVHYGKLYTIEHNFKVSPYGVVNQSSQTPLMGQFQQVNAQRLGFIGQPLQTLREEWTPDMTPGTTGQGPQRPADTRPLLPPQYQRAMARHPTNAAAGSANPQQPARPNAGGGARAPQRNPPGRGAGPPNNAGRPTEPPGFVESLRRGGFNEAQIRAIRDMMARGRTAQYAVARTRALGQLRCTPETADFIAQAVQNGTPYDRVIAQYRARAAQAAQRSAPGSAGSGDQNDNESDAEEDNGDDADD